MADNVVVSAGTGDGATFRTDDVGGVQHACYKLMFGADGTATFVEATAPLPVISRGFSASVSITRTADVNAYLAGDIIGAATGSTAGQTFALSSSAGEFVITGAEMLIEASAVISGESSYRLHLYSITPPSASGDNAVWDLPSGDRNSYLGYIDLGTPLDVGSSLYVQNDTSNVTLPKQVTLASGSVYGYLVTLGAYTPTSARVYRVKIHGFAG